MIYKGFPVVAVDKFLQNAGQIPTEWGTKTYRSRDKFLQVAGQIPTERGTNSSRNWFLSDKFLQRGQNQQLVQSDDIFLF